MLVEKMSGPKSDPSAELLAGDVGQMNIQGVPQSANPQINNIPNEPPPAYSTSQETDALYTSEMRTLSNMSTRSESSRLQKPIAIPATSKKLGSPFLRAYPPCLENYRITQDLFINFIDDLNRITVKSPPLQVLSMAGGIVGMVPMGITQIVGTSIQVASGVATTVISKGRTEVLLRDANKNIFMPRGLKCQIAKVDAVAEIAGIPNVLDAQGHLRQNAQLLEPPRTSDFQGYENGSILPDSQRRRLDALGEYIQPLKVDGLPYIDTPSNPLSKWSANQSEKQRRKEERKMEKKIHKSSRKSDKRETNYEGKMLELERRKQQLLNDPSPSAAKELRKVEQRQQKVQSKYDERTGKARDGKNKKNKEEKKMQKILWIIIRELSEKEKEEFAQKGDAEAITLEERRRSSDQNSGMNLAPQMRVRGSSPGNTSASQCPGGTLAVPMENARTRSRSRSNSGSKFKHSDRHPGRRHSNSSAHSSFNSDSDSSSGSDSDSD